MNRIQTIYKLYPKSIWLYTLVVYMYIARKTIFNVTREIGTFEANIDRGTSLALLAIIFSIFILYKNKQSVIQLNKKVSIFSIYYLFALFSFIWANNIGTITFKAIEVITNFYLIAFIIYKIKNPTLILFYIILSSTFTTFLDIINVNIRLGWALSHHTNAYTFTALIALLLSLGCIKMHIINYAKLRLIIFFNIYALLAGTSSASYIAFIIGLIILLGSNKKGINIFKTGAICIILYICYYYFEDIMLNIIFKGKSQEAIENGTGRLSIWTAALRAWEASPLWGHGFLVGERSLWKFDLQLMVVSAHNAFISVLVNTGIIGGIIFIYFWLKWIWKVFHTSSKNKYAIIIFPVIISVFINCNAFPAIGSDWNYVAPSIYSLITFSFVNLKNYANHLGYKKFS